MSAPSESHDSSARKSIVPPLDPAIMATTARTLATMSHREIEVLSVMLSGCTAQDAALSLGASPRTVEVHVRSILKQLGVNRFAEAILYVAAAEWGGAYSSSWPVERLTKRPPKVPIRKSVRPNYIVCLECGQRCKLLKRHLREHHRLTSAQYIILWDLPGDYPMVALSHSRFRSERARAGGFGAAGR